MRHGQSPVYQYTLNEYWYAHDRINTIAGCVIAGQLVASPAAALFYQCSIYTKADLRTAVILRTLVPWHHCKVDKPQLYVVSQALT